MEKSVERVWIRNERKILGTIVRKLKYNFNLKSYSEDELMSEAMDAFFSNFYRIYETDNQYLRYVFIVMKNKMIDLKKREKKDKIFVTDDGRIVKGIRCKGGNLPMADGDPIALNLVRKDETINIFAENEVADQYEVRDVHEAILSKLMEEEHKQVFEYMLMGYKRYEIANLLEISPNKVGNIRNKYIWPSVKEVLNISDSKYKYLTSSGRICVTCA